MAKSSSQPGNLDVLTYLNTQDFLRAFGLELEQLHYSRNVLELLCRPLARQFARQVVYFDRLIGAQGLQAGGAWFVRRFAKRVVVSGARHIPASGPVMVVSNHPGLADTLALFAAISRPDLKVVGKDRPFIRALPNLAKRIIYVPDGKQGRTQAIRAIVAYLRAGGAILTFPAGTIEPDPASLEGAREALDGWSESIALMARLVPELQIVPVIVSGVLAPAALHHPISRLRRKKADQELLAATLQILVQVIMPAWWSVDIHLAFGPPLQAAKISGVRNTAAIKQQIIAATAALLPASKLKPGAH